MCGVSVGSGKTPELLLKDLQQKLVEMPLCTTL
jgi:hypothetical protein